MHHGRLRRGSRTFRRRRSGLLAIFCSGACSHVDTFDYKPELIARHGQPLPGADKLITFQGEQGNVTQSVEVSATWRMRQDDFRPCPASLCVGG